MFKKIVAFVCVFALCLSFAGCIQSDNADGDGIKSPSSSPAEFLPYMSGYKCDKENGYWTECNYGLMTADGEVYAEPKYNSCQTFESGGKTYYCLKINEGDWETVCHESLLVSADGSLELIINDNVVCLSENRIICSQHTGAFNVYDYSGNKIFSGNETQSVDSDGNGFYNGLLVVYDFLSEKDNVQVRDEDGAIVLDGFDYCGAFKSGKAVASYNRDNGYGIISPEGEWLLEPTYTSVTDVDGRYFVAVNYDTLEIYDSDLKLLRSHPCSPFVEQQYYFFITDGGKLVKYYSHIDAPDRFIYDAFTDKAINYNGINATEYMEYLGHFYDITDGTALIFDENGKLFARHENVATVEEYDGAYAVRHNDNTVDYYNGQTHEKMITLNFDADDWKPVQTVGDCSLVAIGDLEYIGDSMADGPYHLYDYKKGEYVFKDCEFCEIKEFGDKTYITVAYSDRIETYDSSLRLILKTENNRE